MDSNVDRLAVELGVMSLNFAGRTSPQEVQVVLLVGDNALAFHFLMFRLRVPRRHLQKQPLHITFHEKPVSCKTSGFSFGIKNKPSKSCRLFAKSVEGSWR